MPSQRDQAVSRVKWCGFRMISGIASTVVTTGRMNRGTGMNGDGSSSVEHDRDDDRRDRRPAVLRAR